MDIQMIAKQMSEKYEEDRFKWTLMLKRLEFNGYEVIKKEEPKIVCQKCGREIIPSNGKITEHQGKPICYHCSFNLLFEK